VWVCDQGRELICELYYMLHFITKDTFEDISDTDRVIEKLKLFEHQGTLFNERVMAALIESGMIKRLLGQKAALKDWSKPGQEGHKSGNEKMSLYPEFLNKMLKNTQRTEIISACVT
jgi:hypothetical protein